MTPNQIKYLAALRAGHKAFGYDVPIRFIACESFQRQCWRTPFHSRRMVMLDQMESLGWVKGEFQPYDECLYIFDPTFTNWFILFLEDEPNLQADYVPSGGVFATL